jgi:hypothetical protein
VPVSKTQQDGVQGYKVPHYHHPFDNPIRLIVVSHNSPFSQKTIRNFFSSMKLFIVFFFFKETFSLFFFLFKETFRIFAPSKTINLVI